MPSASRFLARMIDRGVREVLQLLRGDGLVFGGISAVAARAVVDDRAGLPPRLPDGADLGQKVAEVFSDRSLQVVQMSAGLDFHRSSRLSSPARKRTFLARQSFTASWKSSVPLEFSITICVPEAGKWRPPCSKR